MIHAFIYGAVLAFGLIIPLGVQNIFVFNQGATQKTFWRAIPSIITAFIGDALLILCAVLGISALVLTMPILQRFILGIGFIFLIYMGWITWGAKPDLQKGNAFSVKKQIGFALSVSLFNPHALIDTIGVIGTNSLQFIGREKIIFTAACIFVSLIWFVFLGLCGHFFHKLDKSGMGIVLVNKVSALIIWVIAAYLFWQMFRF